MPRFRTLSVAILAISPLVIANAEPATEIEIPQGDPEALKDALESRGWRVEKDAGGDLLVYPATAAEASATATATATSKKPDADNTTDLVVDVDQLGELEAMAKQRGWKVERNAAGDLLLYPSTFVGGDASQKTEPAKKSEFTTPTADTTIDATALDHLEQTLGKKGWQVERNADGDLLLYPAAADEQRPPGQHLTVHVTAFKQCVDDTSETIHLANISLPIGSESDAKAIANAWLTVFGKGGDSIGKIRRVNMLYIVSVVSSKQPHTLLRQLVIDQRTGNVISIP